MTQAVETPENVTTPTGSSTGPFTTVFTYELASEVVVSIIDADGIETVLEETADYTLAAISGDSLANGGEITLQTAAVPNGVWDGERLARRRQTPVSQPQDFGDTAAFSPSSAEAGLDRQARINQELRARSSRGVHAPVGEAGMSLPSASARRGMLAYFADTAGAALSILSLAGLQALIGQAFKGDPGGNTMAVGLFTALGELTIPVGTDLIRTTGFSVRGAGSAWYALVDEDDVAGLNDALEGLTWTTSANGRVFALSLGQVLDITLTGALPDGDALTNTGAIQALMIALLDRFTPDTTYYPGGSGDPTDFTSSNRQTGKVWVPAGCFPVLPGLFSAVDHERANLCGFEFVGEGKLSSILLLETDGAEAWFYENSAADPTKFQRLHFHDVGLRSDDWRYGHGFKIWSDGGPKQFRWTDCDFQNLQNLYQTEGTGNADLVKVTRCTGHFFGDIIILDNEQSVQHDFIGSDFGTYGHFIHVKQRGGGNVNVINASIDWTWHEDYSPAGGNFMYYEDADANVGQGNCTFTFRDSRVEVEAYKSTGGAPPFGLVKTFGEPDTAFPRILFDGVNFVNGATYTIDGAGAITGQDYRRITAVKLYPGEHVHFRNSVLLKNFFYELNGDNDDTSPSSGGIIRFTDCFDGVTTELPTADVGRENLHTRVIRNGNAGRVITEGMVEHTTGSAFVRRVLDADVFAKDSFGREPSSVKRLCFFKPTGNGWPLASGAGNDHYLIFPSGLTVLRLYVEKPATGVSANTYALKLGNSDKSATYHTSTSAAGEFKDLHVFDLDRTALTLPAADASGNVTLRLWAEGVGADFQTGGLAYIEYV